MYSLTYQWMAVCGPACVDWSMVAHVQCIFWSQNFWVQSFLGHGGIHPFTCMAGCTQHVQLPMKITLSIWYGYKSPLLTWMKPVIPSWNCAQTYFKDNSFIHFRPIKYLFWYFCKLNVTIFFTLYHNYLWPDLSLLFSPI